MKTKIVYVLVSRESDYFYEMVLLSLYSFRLYHPKDAVEVVMDEDTYERLVSIKSALLDDVTPVVVSVPAEYSNMQRSRYLKVRLRQIVKGDFLFLDCDTLVCESLEDIDKTDAEIAMVADQNGPLPLRDTVQVNACRDAGFLDLEGEPYYNGGVIYCKDCDTTAGLYERIYDLWLQSVDHGVSRDQPAMTKANVLCGYPVKELDGIWNCQVVSCFSKGLRNRARIVHFWYSLKYGRVLMINYMFGQVRVKGSVTGVAAEVALNPRKAGYSVLTMTDEEVLRLTASDFGYIFKNHALIYRSLSCLSRLLMGPARVVSRLKKCFVKEQA